MTSTYRSIAGIDTSTPTVEGLKILITGGAGFIGSHLVERLAGPNQIVILDNFARDALTASGLADRPEVQVVRGDVMDRASVQAAMENCDTVIHLASIAGVDTVIRSPVRTMEVGLLGTANVLREAVRLGHIKRFVDLSTSEVFGRYAYKVSEGDVTHLGVVGEARWTYAVAKLATEHLAMCYQREQGLPAVSVRPFNVFGARQVGEGAIHNFIVRALRDEPILIHNDGSQIRSWCHVDDLVEGLLLALSRPQAVGQVFNIGNPRSTLTIYALAKEIVRICGSKSQIRFIPWDYPDVELRIPSIVKARKLLGFEPKVDLDEGLKRTIEWYRANLEGNERSPIDTNGKSVRSDGEA
ncbi:MAG: NAD-dependent epimerase/dehydratase family protein [Deltaproteobacteria bacterium]|nr:NAD-dependent epimerase/dehydratase family protein [Deltaproteobacteria bacterium]